MSIRYGTALTEVVTTRKTNFTESAMDQNIKYWAVTESRKQYTRSECGPRDDRGCLISRMFYDFVVLLTFLYDWKMW